MMLRLRSFMLLALILVSVFGMAATASFQYAYGREALNERINLEPWLRLTLFGFACLAVFGSAFLKYLASKAERFPKWVERFQILSGTVFGFSLLTITFSLSVSFFTGIGRAEP